MKVELDRQRDAAYFAFSVGPSARQVKLDNARMVRAVSRRHGAG